MSSNPTFHDIWNKAFRDYLSSTGRSAEDAKKLKTLQNTDDLVHQLEIDHGKFRDWRGHSRLASTVKQAISPFLLLSEVAMGGTSLTPFAPASAVLGAVLFLVKAADGVSEAYNMIEELLGELREFAQRLAEYIDGGMSSQVEHKVIEILCCLLGVLGRSEKVIKDGRFRKYATVLFLRQDEHVKDLLTKLKGLMDNEERLVVATSYANTQRLLRRANSIEVTVKQTREDLARHFQEKTAEQGVVAQRGLLQQALDHPARIKNSLLYSEYSDDTLRNSGEWIFADKGFQDWMGRKSPLLWVRGGPGTGKSFLSAITISKLQQAYPQDDANQSLVSVAFFYIKGNDQDLQDLSGLLKTIAWQIAGIDMTFRDHVLNVTSQPEKVLTTRKLWESLFVNFYCRLREASKAALIVIDGLDEAPQRTIKDFFRLLNDLVDTVQGSTSLSLALFGRQELGEYIDLRLEQAFTIIDIGENNDGDIDMYVRSRLNEVLVYKQALRTKTKSAALKLAKQIRDRITAKADGMFFKVKLIIDQLLDRERLSAVFEAIDEAPVQLKEMIGRIFQRLSASEDVDDDDLKELLFWVTLSRRPLTIAELYAILRDRTGRPYEVLEARLTGRFASLFKLTYVYGYEHFHAQQQINEENTSEHDGTNYDPSFGDDDTNEVTDSHLDFDNHFTDREDDMGKGEELSCDTIERFQLIEVRFSHSSIRDFLVNRHSESLMQSLDPWTGIDVGRADLHMTLSCMRNILDHDWDEKVDCRFLSYAATYFMDHLISANGSDVSIDEKQPVLLLICRLLFSPIGVWKLIKATMLDCNRALHTWFESPSFSNALQKHWLQYAACEYHPSDEFEWMQKAANSRTELFKPLATEACRMWLVRGNRNEPEDAMYEGYHHALLYKVWIVHCYLNMDDSEDYAFKPLEIGGLIAGQPPAYELEQLETMVKFAGLPETPHWHTSYAWLLLLAGLEDEALDHFNEALQVEHSSWKALQGKSKCLAQQGEFGEAISTTLEALKTAPKWANLQEDLTEMHLAEKDFNAALKHSRALYLSVPTSESAIRGYIASLYALDDHEQVVTALETFRESQTTSQTWNGTQFLQLRSVHHEIGCSFRIQHKFELLRPWLDACIVKYTHGPQPIPWYSAWFGEFAYSFFDDVDEAMRIFEYILSRKFKAALVPELMWAYDYPQASALGCLSQIYREEAVRAHEAGKDTQVWISKLKKLATSSSAKSVYDYNPITHASLWLGVYLRRYEGADESTWKSCFRDSILEGISLLNDENCRGSSKVFSLLAQVLLAAGKRSAAIEAMAVALTYTEAASMVRPMKAWDTSKLSVELYRCNGPCTSQFNRYKDPPFKELYLCEDCVGTAVCEDCISIAKDGRLPFRKCNPRHSFIRVLPIPEEAEMIAARFTNNNKGIKISESWINAIRDEWL